MSTITNYQSFFENAPVGFWRTSINDGQFLMANLCCAKILGFPTVQDLLSSKSINMYTGDDREIILKKIKEEGCIHNYEVQIMRPDGFKIWISITARQEQDFIEGFIEDITHEKELKEQLCNLRQQEVDKLGEVQKHIKKRIKDISISLDGKHKS